MSIVVYASCISDELTSCYHAYRVDGCCSELVHTIACRSLLVDDISPQVNVFDFRCRRSMVFLDAEVCNIQRTVRLLACNMESNSQHHVFFSLYREGVLFLFLACNGYLFSKGRSCHGFNGISFAISNAKLVGVLGVALSCLELHDICLALSDLCRRSDEPVVSVTIVACAILS